MERPSKRRKPNDHGHCDEEEGQHSNGDTEYRDGRRHESNRLNGQGIQNSNGQVEVGRDFIVTINSDRAISKEQKQILLETLWFNQIDSRHMSIKKAHAKTCQWLLKTHQYLDWLDTKKLDNHYGFLWIKGKPGAGKSTLMKFAVSHARRTLKQKIVISFFFNARGDDLEKSTVGLYRSLLLQLLEARPALQFVLDSVRMGHQWSVESLKSLFEEAIRALGEDSLVCFIDALDECKESQIRDMVSSLSELAVSVGARVHICFASRHYPHITVQEALGLVLEDQQEHDQDIASYLGSALRIGHDPTAEKIRSELQNKASGVFMWVVLVVDILNKEYDRGRKHTLVDRLRHIPNDLHELFRDILTRDHNNTHGLLLCIQWVLCARQPLTPEQLYFAVISENEPDSLPRCHSDDISRDDILKYILDNSKGLAESTKSKTPTVQFIHESVNDFLLKDNGLKAIWPDLGSNYQGQIHEKLKQCCVKYMSAEPVTHLDLPSPLPKASSKQATALRQSVAEKCPFLEYAHQNILYHADEAESKGVSQKDFLRDFTITDWVRYHNVFEKHQVRRYPPNVRLVYILAESNMSALIRAQPSRQSCFNIGGERYGTPIFAALATESEEAVRTLLEIEAENQLAESLLNGLSRQYAEDGTKVYKFSRDFTFSPQRNVLSHIAELGNEKILGFFLAIREVDIDLIDVSGRTPLSRAAERGNEATVRLLLEKEAQIEARDKYGRTPLSWAAERGNEATVRLLLGKGAQIEAQDDEGWTPLIRAAGKQRNEATVRLLLEKGAQIEAQDISGRTPLLWAADRGNEATVRLLLEKGAQIEAQDISGRTPLLRAAERGNEVTVRLLLEKGAQIQVQDKYGRTPLLWAAGERGNEATVRLLLEKGAQIEARDKYGRTPLSWAADRGNEATVRLLLEKGAQGR